MRKNKKDIGRKIYFQLVFKNRAKDKGNNMK